MQTSPLAIGPYSDFEQSTGALFSIQCPQLPSYRACRPAPSSRPFVPEITTTPYSLIYAVSAVMGALIVEFLCC